MRCYLFTDAKSSQGGIEQPRREDAKFFQERRLPARHLYFFAGKARIWITCATK
jgi:hypothetical protein